MNFIYGQEEYLIEVELKKNILNIDHEPRIFDESSNIEEIIMDITTISLFSDQKTIIVKNHELLKNEKIGENFLQEIKNHVDQVNLYFIWNSPTINKKNPFVKFLLQHAKVKECQKINAKNIITIIKDITVQNGGKISNGTAIKLSLKLPDNLRIIVNEIKKLLIQSKEITDEMVENSIGKYLQEDFFALTNAITSKDNRGIVSAYQQKLQNGDKPLIIIDQISKALSLVNLVGVLRKSGKSNQDISNETNIHIFRVKKSSELLKSTAIDKIQKLILKLSKLDKMIKTGQIGERQGMDAFILDLIK